MLTCSRTVKLTRHQPDLKWAGDLSKMMQVSMVGYAAAGAFLNLSTFDLFYHVLAIVVMAHLIVRNELKKTSTATEAEHATDADTGDQTFGSGGKRNRTTGQNPVLGGASGYLIKRR